MLNEQVPAAAPIVAPTHRVAHSQPDPMTETSTLPPGEASFVSPRELARTLGVTIDSVYRLVAKRVFPAYRILRRILLRRSDIERWLVAHRTDPRDPTLWQ
jgi:excisionase family DNA binding protein